MSESETAYNVKIEPLLNEYFGHIFEDVCLQFLKKQIADGKIETFYTEYGSWWGNNPQKKREEEIDIVLSNDEEILVGECKWKNEKIGSDVLELLKERGELIRKNRKIKYALFSKSGFEDELKENEDLLLFSPSVM